ncbi:MAG: SpoIIE family protein phosphatase [Cyanothece sp. SIO2G6]|nr:SpoIIE family protein phosphatase [Cyanothece sp. SIO2G6]
MAQSGDEKLKLLIVDDETDNLDLLYRIFRQQYQVFRADSAFKALDILKEQGEMAIIISDQRMPRMKGTELLSRTVEPYPDTIRIVLTGYTDAEDLVEAINTGQVFKFVTKPWKTPDLQAIVKQAAETYRAIKQRTDDLRRALRRESVSNSINSAIRESLDVNQMLHAIAETFGRIFVAEVSVLIMSRPVSEESSPVTVLPNPDLICYKQTSSSSPTLQEEDDPHLLGCVRASLLQTGQERGTIRQQTVTIPNLTLSESQPESQNLDEHALTYDQLILPLKYQHSLLAELVLMKQLPAQWDSDDIDLIGLMTEQAALAISQAQLHQQIQRQSKRMQAELAVARQIQTNLLRQQWQAPDNVKISACCRPAQEVGGDFFEVYIHPKGEVWLAVGDVSGKGVPAALLMASAISVLRRELYQDSPSDPDVIMRNLNSSLMDSLIGSNCFITMTLARYTLSNNGLTYANAGHIYPMVWSQPQVEKQLMHLDSHASACEPNYLTQRGVPLGILAEWSASAGQLQMTSGDILLLASDGITEATVPIQLVTPAPIAQPVDAASPPSLSHKPRSTDEFTMLRQSGLWQLLLQERGQLNLDNILDILKVGHNLQEDDQTLLSMEIL